MKYKLLKFRIRKGYRKLTSLVISRIYKDTIRDLGKSILVVGSARSGTTWLANIIASQGKSRIMFEPFNPNLVPEYSKFNYFQYMRSDEYDQDLYDYCRKVFTGKIRNAWIDREIQHLHPQNRVIKCIRSSLMLRWLDIQFPDVPKLFIIRHPCAVVLSRMKLGWATDDDIGHFLSQPKLISDFLEDKIEVIAKADSDEEKHAVIWCVTNLVPIRQFHSNKLNLVRYEKLVINPDEVIPMIFHILGLPFNDQIFSYMKRPSSTSKNTSAILIGKNITEQWKDELSSQQIDKIFSIVEEFGLSNLFETPSASQEITIIR
jgi:hypothetical protein